MNDETKLARPGRHDVVQARYWFGTPPTVCQMSGRKITTEFVDGRVPGIASWANMHPAYFRSIGGTLGTGNGQRYRKQADGRWLKVEG